MRGIYAHLGVEMRGLRWGRNSFIWAIWFVPLCVTITCTVHENCASRPSDAVTVLKFRLRFRAVFFWVLFPFDAPIESGAFGLCLAIDLLFNDSHCALAYL